MAEIIVSVIVPLYNEERYIDECVRSMLAQDYPKDRMEWFFADGMSQDRTVEILEGYRAEHPGLINIIENPDRTVPYAMNLGIRASRGEYIIRLDAHAVYALDYFSACVRVLERTGADNVGGAIETRARTKTGKCFRQNSAWAIPASAPAPTTDMSIPCHSARSKGMFLTVWVCMTSA